MSAGAGDDTHFGEMLPLLLYPVASSQKVVEHLRRLVLVQSVQKPQLLLLLEPKGGLRHCSREVVSEPLCLENPEATWVVPRGRDG